MWTKWSNVLIHCNLIWKGKLSFKIANEQKVSYQLPIIGTFKMWIKVLKYVDSVIFVFIKILILRTLKIQQGQNYLKKLRNIISKRQIWKEWCKDYDYNSEIEPCKDKVANEAVS